MKRLILSLLLTSLILPTVLAQSNYEPNTPVTELAFKVYGQRIDWIVSDNSEEKLFHNPDVNRPPYVAELWLHWEHRHYRHKSDMLANIKKSPVFQELSKRQHEFLDTGYAVWIDYQVKHLPDKCQPKPNFFPIWLYAFSKRDAQGMVRVCLDQLNRQIAQKTVSYKRQLADQQQKLQQAQKELTQKREKKNAADEEFQQLRKVRHKFDADPSQSAKDTIKGMRDVLDKLDIELTGSREKLKSIEAFRKGTGKQSLSPQVQIKLDEMYIELMIELSGLEARKATTERIQDQESDFLDLYFRVEKLNSEVRHLDTTIQNYQENTTRIAHRLENPTYDMRPPKVHKNTVHIRRVNGSYAPEDVQAHIQSTEALLSEDNHLNRTGSRLNQTQHFLSMVDSGYLRVEPGVVEDLKAIQQQLRVVQVKRFLLNTRDAKFSLVRVLRSRVFRQELDGHIREENTARHYLALAEQGQLQLEPLALEGLRYMANDLAREVLESGLQQAEKMASEEHDLSPPGRSLITNLRLLQNRIDQNGLRLDPSLVQRIDDCLKKLEEPQKNRP